MSGMRMIATGVVAVVALGVGGCGSNPEQPASAGETTTAVEEVAASGETSGAGDLAACRQWGDGGEDSLMERIPPALTSIGATMTDAQMDEMLAIYSGLTLAILEAEDPDLVAGLAALREPFGEFKAVYDAGGGDLTMDTSHVTEDTTAVMAACVDAGYTIDQ